MGFRFGQDLGSGIGIGFRVEVRNSVNVSDWLQNNFWRSIVVKQFQCKRNCEANGKANQVATIIEMIRNWPKLAKSHMDCTQKCVMAIHCGMKDVVQPLLVVWNMRAFENHLFCPDILLH